MNVERTDGTGLMTAGIGVFVALVGVATLAGMPWQYLDGGVALAIGRVLGGLLAIVLGGAAVWLAVRE